MATAGKNHAFFCHVKEEVNKLSLTSIIEKYTKVHRNHYSDSDALCPLHGDTEFGNFKINDKKGIYKCFACGAYGDGIQFVKEFFKLAFKPAVMKIAVDNGIITEKQAEEYLGGKISDVNVQMVALENQKGKDKVNGITEVADANTRDMAYRVFLHNTTLSDAHRQYLRDERGLSDEEINEKGFFTFPEPTDEFLDRLYKTLGHITPNLFKEIPGFHTEESMMLPTFDAKREREYRYTFAKHKGIGIPVKNAYEQFIGIQIRRDTVGDKKKRYTWFSSSYAQYDENKFIFGTPAGAPTHVAYPKENRFPNVAFVTEGFFKAEQIARTFGAVCVSVSGVGNYRSVAKDLRGIEIETGNKIEHIYVSYDADMCQNMQVYNHAKNMVTLIKETFAEAAIYMTLWNEKDGKGIDDLIQNKKANTLKKVDFEQFAVLYDAMMAGLEKEYPILNRVPKEEVEKRYFTNVFPKVYAS